MRCSFLPSIHPGHAFDIDGGVLTPEQIAAKFEDITDFDDEPEYPDSTSASMGIVMSQLQSKL